MEMAWRRAAHPLALVLLTVGKQLEVASVEPLPVAVSTAVELELEGEATLATSFTMSCPYHTLYGTNTRFSIPLYRTNNLQGIKLARTAPRSKRRVTCGNRVELGLTRSYLYANSCFYSH